MLEKYNVVEPHREPEHGVYGLVKASAGEWRVRGLRPQALGR